MESHKEKVGRHYRTGVTDDGLADEPMKTRMFLTLLYLYSTVLSYVHLHNVL